MARALDECLAVLAEGDASVEQCLAAHPDVADELRPLLEVAKGLRRAPRRQPSARAQAIARAAMLQSARLREQKRAPGAARRGSVGLRRLTVAAIACLALVIAAALVVELALPPVVARAAVVLSHGGPVEIMSVRGGQWRPVAPGQRIGEGWRVRTGDGGAVVLGLGRAATIEITAESEIEMVTSVSRPSGRDHVLVVRLVSGEAVTDLKRDAPSGFDMGIDTEHGRVHARSGPGRTRFSVQARSGETRIAVLVGRATVESREGSRELGPGITVLLEGDPASGQPERRERETPPVGGQEVQPDQGERPSTRNPEAAGGQDGAATRLPPETEREVREGGVGSGDGSGTPQATAARAADEVTATPKPSATGEPSPQGTRRGGATRTHDPTPSGPNPTPGESGQHNGEPTGASRSGTGSGD